MPRRRRTLSDEAQSIVEEVQKGMRDSLNDRVKRIKEMHERSTFDDVSGDGLARLVRAGIQDDKSKLVETFAGGDTNLELHWNKTLGAAHSALGNEEDIVCKIADGRSVINSFKVGDTRDYSFWGTETVAGISYATWAMHDSVASFAFSNNDVSQTIYIGTEEFQISVRADTCVYSAPTIKASLTDLEGTLSPDFRLSAGPTSIAMFHSGFNDNFDVAYSPSVPSELDVLEKSLKAAYPSYSKFHLRPKGRDARPSTADLVQMRDSHFGFMLSDRHVLAATGNGFAKYETKPGDVVAIYDINQAPASSVCTINFSLR